MGKDEHPPAFQFYPRDFLSDPAVLCMTLAQTGAYIRLLCAAWLSEEPGVLPDDDSILASLSGSHSDWTAIRPAVARAFKVGAGKWTQKRMVQERSAQRERYKKAAKGAEITNAKRWQSQEVESPSDPIATRRAVTPASASASASASAVDSLPSVESLEPARPEAASVRSSEYEGAESPARAPEPVAVAEPNPFTPPPSRQQTVEDAIHAECVRLKTGPNVERTAQALANKIKAHSPWIDPRDRVGVVRYWLERRSTIENVFAYFAKDSEGFVFTERAVRLEREQAEHEANKRAPVGPIISRLAQHFTMPTNGTKP